MTSDFNTIRSGLVPRALRDEQVAALAALSRVQAASEHAEKALEPFGTGSQAFDRTESTYGDGPVFERSNSEATWLFTVSDVRRAAAALAVLRDTKEADA